MSLGTPDDGETRDERLKRLSVLGAAFTLIVLGEERFDVVDSLLGYLALLIAGTGALFVLREGIDRAWKAHRRRRARGHTANSPERPRQPG